MFQVNGQEYQHALVELEVMFADGGPPAQFGGLTTFRKMKYKDGAKKEGVRDKNGRIRGFVIKDQETDGSISMLKSEYYQLRQWIKTQRPTLGIGQVLFDAVVSYGGSPTTLKTDKVRFMFQELEEGSENNQEAHVADLPLFVFSVDTPDGRFIEYGR